MDSESLEQPDVPANDKEHLSSESEQAGGAGGAESNVEAISDSKSSENPSSRESHSTSSSQPIPSGTLKHRYMDCMVLSAVGDAMGFYNGEFEFHRSGQEIHDTVNEDLGGLDKLEIKLPDWPVSDDTVMHIATAEALVTSAQSDSTDADHVLHQLAKEYMECRSDLDGRAPGITTLTSLPLLKPFTDKGYRIKFGKRSGGCGAAMRAMCIGLRFHSPSDLPELIRVSVESGRMTHHHPTGFLGSFTSALFTSYAVQDKPVHQWGHDLMVVLEQVKEYVKTEEHCVEQNLGNWDYFSDSWENYLTLRQISDGTSLPVFTREDEIGFRDELYKSWSWGGWGGASGHDSVMIAYDALLGCAGSWDELCRRGVLHGGDNDSTGAIAGAWYGALYGDKDANYLHFHNVEYEERLCDLGQELYDISHST